MTTEREHSHATATPDRAADHDDLAVGRVSRSSQLDAPTNPIATSLIARKAARDDNGVADGADHAVAKASGSSGMSLPEPIMRKFESSLGADLSGVRVHTGGESQAAAHAVGARAYTMGQDIHFGAGQYDPSSGGGEHLLAHEVAHTVQQQGGTPTRQNKLEVSSPVDAAEHEADRAADAMVSGRQATIASAPMTASRKVFRDASPAAAQVDDKVWFDLPAVKLGTIKLKYANISFQVKGKASFQAMNADPNGKAAPAPVTVGGTGGAHGLGVKGEVELAKQEFGFALFGVNFEGSWKEKLSFELSQDQFKAAFGAENRTSWEDLPWLKGALDLNFIFAGVKWADLAKDPDNIKILAPEVALGLSGEGVFTSKALQTGYKCAVTSQIVCTVQPNWVAIGAEAASQGAKTGATTTGSAAATTATATTASAATSDAAAVAAMVDTGATASAAAAVILPFGVAALLVAGGMQEDKNTKASLSAIDMGLKMRREAKSYVLAYTAALGGRSATGQGATDANAKLMAYMSATGKKREEAGSDIVQQNGGSQKLSDELLSKIRGVLYPKGVAEFETRFADQFGVLEKLGENWGMRGTFRKDFYRMLYGDD